MVASIDSLGRIASAAMAAGLILTSPACSSSQGSSTPNVDCSPHQDCSTCMPVNGCGWCGVAPGGSNAAGFCSATQVGCATYFYNDSCPSPYGGSSAGSGGGSGGSGATGAGIAGMTNPPVSCNISSSAQELPGQYGGCSCSLGTECVGSSGPSQYLAGNNTYIGCSTQGTCCGPQGHPETSCPSGYSCSPAGGCTPGGGESGSSSGTTGTTSGGAGSSSGVPSSSGSSATCHNLTTCVQADTHSTNDCSIGIGYDLINNCGQAAYCRVCAVAGGVVDDNECQAFTVTGSDIGQSFCGSQYDNVRYECAWTTDDVSCVRGF